MNRREVLKKGCAATLLAVMPHSIMRISKYTEMETQKEFDAIIIGGSYSGLSAAMALGRSLRQVLIIDSGLPCNRQTPASHNFITQDGIEPAKIAAKARDQVMKYDTVRFLEDRAVQGQKKGKRFEIHTESGKSFISEKLIFATGIKDIMPDIKGLAECWGISVVHCPYCHGYEIRDKKTAILANGERAFHLAPMAGNLTDQLTIITSGQPEFDTDQLALLQKNNIRVVDKSIREVIHNDGKMNAVIYTDGSTEEFDAVYAALPFEQHSDIPQSLGCEINEQGYIQVDMMAKTTIEGVFACGDNCSRMRSVANAVAAGNIAGAVANMEMSMQDFHAH